MMGQLFYDRPSFWSSALRRRGLQDACGSFGAAASVLVTDLPPPASILLFGFGRTASESGRKGHSVNAQCDSRSIS